MLPLEEWPELAAAFAALPSIFAGWQIELFEIVVEPAELERRIERRVSTMLAAGLVEEVRRLRIEGLERNPSAARAIGYRETAQRDQFETMRNYLKRTAPHCVALKIEDA